MAQITRRTLCIFGLVKLIMACFVALLACLGGVWQLWERTITAELLGLALAIGFGGHALIASSCLPKQDDHKSH